MLPRRNYGKRFDGVMACVRDAALRRWTVEEFSDQLGKVEADLPKDSKRRYIGCRDLIFKPAPERHGAAPAWRDDGSMPAEHSHACAIRGRVRFGAPVDPERHYNCVPSHRRMPREFRSCHGQVVARPRHSHVNIGLNDSVR